MTPARWMPLVPALLLLGACSDPAPAALSADGASAGPGAQAPSGVAFDAVTVIDATSGARPDQRVIVRDDRIVAVQPMSEALETPVAQHIDGAGRFLIPGLWDMHVHFLYEPELTAGMGELFLEYGITSVRDTGGDMAQLVALRDGMRSAGRPAPRVFVSGPLLDGPRVIYDGANSDQPALGVAVDSPEAAQERVLELASAGADFIKIYELIEPPVFAALVEAARRQNLPIAAHVPLTMSADVAGPAVDSMEHMRNLELACAGDWEALLAERLQTIEDYHGERGHALRSDLHAAQRLPAIAHYDEARCAAVLATLGHTIQVPTLRLNSLSMTRPYERADWALAVDGLPPSVADRWRQSVRERQAEELEDPEDTRFDQWSLFLAGRLHERGVPIGAGTDTPIGLAIPGYSLHTELELLVRSGLPPLEALRAATETPARFFGLEGEMGQIAPGMAADLVLLGADPLADIGNTRRIEGVMAAGRWLPAPPR